MEIINKPKRLLCIVSSMNTGGAETFLMKIYRTIDKNKYQMDFYCMSTEEGYYEKEIISLGGRVFHSVPKSKRPIGSFLKLVKTVKKEEYKCVMRVSQHALSTLDLVAAHMGGANMLIQRSSNSSSNSHIGKVLHEVFKFLTMLIPTLKIAPSTEAAKYTFGKKSIEKGRVKIIKNAISIKEFVFNMEIRDRLRKEFNIKNEFVMGHVGRFTNQKNHNFLIEIFNEVVKNNSNSILMLIGEGELEEKIKEKIILLKLEEKVIFTGIRSDISHIMMAMDVFIFPSLYEGMPNTVIEAQATGLKCLISDTITSEANITGLVDYLSLNETPESWGKRALDNFNGYERKNMESVFIEKKYDMELVAKELERYIFIHSER